MLEIQGNWLRIQTYILLLGFAAIFGDHKLFLNFKYFGIYISWIFQNFLSAVSESKMYTSTRTLYKSMAVKRTDAQIKIYTPTSIQTNAI